MAISPAEPKPSAGRVLFLADCGPEIGGGHVMRCLALARALMDRGAEVGMVSTPAVDLVLDAFADPGLERIEASLAGAAAIWGADIVVVDHYRLDADAEAECETLVAVIDDLADRPHDCALLIDPSLGRAPEDYAALTPEGAIVLTGPSYALLAPAYAQLRPKILAERRPLDPPRRLLISLGLMDLNGLTGRVLELIRPQLAGVDIDVVVGGQASSLEALRRLSAADPRVRLHVDTREMAALIAAADIGIGAGGVSTWERATLGLPSISLILADNQRALALELDRRGACLAVDAGEEAFADNLVQAFNRLSTVGPLREKLSETSAALCDGGGAARVAQALLQLIR